MWLKISKIAFAVIIAFSLLFYFVILPMQKFDYQKQQDLKEELDRSAKEFQEKLNKESADRGRTLCLSSAYLQYLELVKLNATSNDDWQTWKYKSNNLSDFVEDSYKEYKNDCYKKYPVN